MLAAKAALACRADALAESIESAVKDKKLDKSMKTKLEALNNGMLGVEGRAKVEARLRMLEGKISYLFTNIIFFIARQLFVYIFKTSVIIYLSLIFIYIAHMSSLFCTSKNF